MKIPALSGLIPAKRACFRARRARSFAAAALSALFLAGCLMEDVNDLVGGADSQTGVAWSYLIDTRWYDDNPGAAEFYISTPEELAGLAEIVNSVMSKSKYGGETFQRKTVRLANGIDLSAFDAASAFNGGKGWIPIGAGGGASSYGRFNGTFDGGGHEVTGMYINDNSLDYAGLFGYLGTGSSGDSARVGNLGVVGVNITARDYAGGAVGCVALGGRVANVYTAGTVAGREYVGGVAGRVYGSDGYYISTSAIANTRIERSYSTSYVSGRGYVGGIAGAVAGTVTGNAALNRSVRLSGYGTVGRVAGSTTGSGLSNNVAFAGMGTSGGSSFSTAAGAATVNGAGIAAAQTADGTIGGLFTGAGGWVTEPGKLPGLGGVRDLPDYLVGGTAIVTISFDLNGGTGPQPAPVKVWQGGAAGDFLRPSADSVVMDGHFNDGKWYTDREGASEFRFGDGGTAVARDTALYLRWIPIPDWYDSEITGAGTETNPYVISSPRQLAFVAVAVNNGYSFGGTDYLNRAHYRLDRDLDLSEYYGPAYQGVASPFNKGRGWVPIGTFSSPFKGVFDGGGNVIRGLYAQYDTTGADSLNYVGLFGYADSGQVRNLGLANVNVKGAENVGGIAGAIRIVERSYVTGTVRGANSVGGVAGAIVRVNNSALLGGRVTNSYFSGAVSGRNYVGGVAGRITAGSASNCYSAGTVAGTGSVGGVAGYLYYISNIPTRVNNCYSVSTVTASSYGSSYPAGGIVGYGYSTISVTGCAALSPSVRTTSTYYTAKDYVGRVGPGNGGTVTRADNAAFTGMGTIGTHFVNSAADPSGVNGADITKAQITADGTIGGRFTSENGWTAQNGRLPGLFGSSVEMPSHLR